MIYGHACAMGIEGIVAKAKDAPYRSGRQDTWLKLKCTKSDGTTAVMAVEGDRAVSFIEPLLTGAVQTAMILLRLNEVVYSIQSGKVPL
jgi:ATP-dependent DNA ligase